MSSHQPLTERLARARAGTAGTTAPAIPTDCTAPAWTGDPHHLSDHDLDARIASLSSHIAALSTGYVVGEFTPRNADEFERDARPWICQRARLLNLRQERGRS